MYKLLKVDLYKLKKDKTALIGAIISAALLLFTVGLTLSIKLLGQSNMAGLEALFAPKSTYVQGFQMGSNAGLVVIIIIAVITTKEFTQNTIRLKIINGFDRKKIYLSTLITNLIYGISIMLGYSLLTLMFNSLLVGYGTEFNAQEIADLVIVTIVAVVYIVLYISLVTAVSMKFQRIGATIGISIGVILAEALLYSFVVMLPILAGNIPVEVYKVLHIFPSVGMGTLMAYTFNAETIAIMLASAITLVVGINLLAVFSFAKSDIK